ncbi:MAG: hypothetical protein ACHP65_03230 [Legionellales bacterium]
MNLNNLPINPKKIPYYLSLTVLTLGASLILGFLSFSGMYAFVPMLPLAFAGFGLSVAYEGEIYLQNIKGAFNKLFKSNYLKEHLATEYLHTMLPKNTDDKDYPQFFKDYAAQFMLVQSFSHSTLNAKSKKSKQQEEKRLNDMKQWFALQLFTTKTEQTTTKSDYAQQLSNWLAKNQQDEWQSRLDNRRLTFHGVKVFSLVAGVFMGLGTTYLIVEAFAVIPVLAAIPFIFWPAIIVPMAVIAGAAYGMLTYNAVTDLINNDTLNKWYNKLRDGWSKKFTWSNAILTATAVLLVGIAIALTICTAGTWWTVATSARPLFEWMGKLPGFVMGIINPIITGVSALFFNVQNTAESLEMVDEALNSKKNVFDSIKAWFSDTYIHLRASENWLQLLNPFRILLKLTVTPLRILLFIGHLISIGVTSDRMPGVPQIVAALIAIISEGFEDAHYFLGHEHGDGACDGGAHHHHSMHELLQEDLKSGHGHNHDTDIPTVILTTIAAPLYFLAAGWDYLASKLNAATTVAAEPVHQCTHDDHHTHTHTHNAAAETPKQPQVLSFATAWNKQNGIAEEQDLQLKPDAQRPSSAWQVEHTVFLIEKYKNQCLEGAWINQKLAQEKCVGLSQVQEQVRVAAKNTTLAMTLDAAKNQAVFNRHRLFAHTDDKTTTQLFIEALPARVHAGM